MNKRIENAGTPSRTISHEEFAKAVGGEVVPGIDTTNMDPVSVLATAVNIVSTRRKLFQTKYSELFLLDGEPHPPSIWHLVMEDELKNDTLLIQNIRGDKKRIHKDTEVTIHPRDDRPTTGDGVLMVDGMEIWAWDDDAQTALPHKIGKVGPKMSEYADQSDFYKGVRNKSAYSTKDAAIAGHKAMMDDFGRRYPSK